MRTLVASQRPRIRHRVIELLDQRPGVNEIITADNGDDALQTIRDGAVDLIICSVDLPGKNGFQLIKETRQQNIATKVILMTDSDNYFYLRESDRFQNTRTVNITSGLDGIVRAIDDTATNTS